MSPTFEVSARAAREYARLSPTKQRQFDEARRALVEALRSMPAQFPGRLRVRGVSGHPGVFELTWEYHEGRATFELGPEQRPGQPHVIWRRIGDHSIFHEP